MSFIAEFNLNPDFYYKPHELTSYIHEKPQSGIIIFKKITRTNQKLIKKN